MSAGRKLIRHFNHSVVEGVCGHINCLELQATMLAVKAFLKNQRKKECCYCWTAKQQWHILTSGQDSLNFIYFWY